LKDRVIIQSIPGAQGIPYWDVVDLIEFPEGRRTALDDRASFEHDILRGAHQGASVSAGRIAST
jgi:hypothetical protein